MNQDATRVELVKTELEKGITFAYLALSAKNGDKLEHNKVNARNAYENTLRFVDTLSPTPEMAVKLDELFKHLRAQLKALGEPV